MTETLDQSVHQIGTSLNSRWMRLARAASIVIVFWAVALQLIVGFVIPPVLAVGVVFATLVPFLTADRPRLGLALAVVALLALGGNIPSLVEEISHPSSAMAFILTLVSASAAVVALIAGAGAYFRWSPTAIGAITSGWVGLFVLGAAASLIIASGVESVPAAAGDIAVVAEGNRFAPAEILAPVGPVGFWIDNRDGARHTFTIRQLGVDHEIPGRKSQRIELEAPPGVYQVFCRVPGHENMQATLRVG